MAESAGALCGEAVTVALVGIVRKLWRAFPFPAHMQRDADIAALRAFIHNIHAGEDLSHAVAHQQYQNGTVELVSNSGMHAANALRVTTHGYLLTSDHCAEVPFAEISGCRYRFEVCERDPYNDLALVKAAVPQSPEAIPYRFSLRKPLLNSLVGIQSRWQGKLHLRTGTVSLLYNEIHVDSANWQVDKRYHFFSSIPSRPGDSGSVVATTQGALIGVTRAGIGPYTVSTTWEPVLELLGRYIARLHR